MTPGHSKVPKAVSISVPPPRNMHPFSFDCMLCAGSILAVERRSNCYWRRSCAQVAHKIEDAPSRREIPLWSERRPVAPTVSPEGDSCVVAARAAPLPRDHSVL